MRHRQLRTRKLSLLPLLVLAASLAFAISMAEVGARLAWGPPAATFLTPAYRDLQTDFDIKYKVQADGTRRVGCRAEGAMVAVIGDSFAFGQGVPEGEDLVSRLACGSPPRSVLNLGSIGQDFLYYGLALHTYVPTDAEAVVLLMYENDLPSDAGISLVKRRLYQYSKLVTMARKAKAEIGKLLHRGEIETFTVEGQPNNPKAVILSNPAFFQDLARPSKVALSQLGEEIRRFVADARRVVPRARIILAMVPEASTVSAGHREFYRSLGDVSLPEFGRPTEIYDAARTACVVENQCHFLDIFPAFKAGGGGLYFPHDFHWNAEGHRVMAELLAEVLAHP